MNNFLFSKLLKNGWLILVFILIILPIKNASAYSFHNQNYTLYQYSRYSLYLGALKPFKKAFNESLKPGVTLNILALTLLKPNLTFNDMENLFKKQETGNPICFSQGGAKTFPPGRSFPAALCWDTYKSGCRSCACQCGYTGYMWDPTTGICGCAQ